MLIFHAGSGEYSPSCTLDAYNKCRLRDALVEMGGRDVEAIAKVQDLYQSCLNTNVTNSLGMLPAIQVLERVGMYTFWIMTVMAG